MSRRAVAMLEGLGAPIGDGPFIFSEVDGVEIGLRPARRGDAVYVMKIKSASRGEGLASEALAAVCEAADQHGVELFLEIEPFGEGGLGEQQLADWYWRFGFRGKPGEMIREPRMTRRGVGDLRRALSGDE